MYSIVRAAPSTAACTLAVMAASPRVGPTVRCSTTSTGTGRAPARMSSARSPASSPVKSPEITVWPPPMPCSQGTEGSTCGLEITWPSSTIATRRVGSPSCWQAAAPVSAAQRRPPSPWNSIATCQRAWSWGSSSARASPTASPVRADGPSRSRPPPSSASTSALSPLGGAVVAGSPGAGSARPSTGWKASWAVRPMTSTASLGS
jgi:hypothetical protein